MCPSQDDKALASALLEDLHLVASLSTPIRLDLPVSRKVHQTLQHLVELMPDFDLLTKDFYIRSWGESELSPRARKAVKFFKRLLAEVSFAKSKSAIAQDARQRGYTAIKTRKASAVGEEPRLHGSQSQAASDSLQVIRPAMPLSWLPADLAKREHYVRLRREETLYFQGFVEWLDHLYEVYLLICMAIYESGQRQTSGSELARLFESQVELERCFSRPQPAVVFTQQQKAAVQAHDPSVYQGPQKYRRAFNKGWEIFQQRPLIRPSELRDALVEYRDSFSEASKKMPAIPHHKQLSTYVRWINNHYKPAAAMRSSKSS